MKIILFILLSFFGFNKFLLLFALVLLFVHGIELMKEIQEVEQWNHG